LDIVKIAKIATIAKIPGTAHYLHGARTRRGSRRPLRFFFGTDEVGEMNETIWQARIERRGHHAAV